MTNYNSFAAFSYSPNGWLVPFFQLAVSFIGKYVWFVAGILAIILFVLWIIGLIGAINGEEKKVPFVGDLFQDWFKAIG